MDIIGQQNEKQWFFLFINSKSGGQVGRQYLTVDHHKIAYQYGNNITIYLYLIDLFHHQQRSNALKKIHKIQEKNSRKGKGKVYAVVCGGDGTVLWVVSIIGQYGIDLNKIIFCIIPLGTGNDFSRCLGWGDTLISFKRGKLEQLKSRLLQWLQAQQSQFDIWHAELNVYEDGQIIKIRDRRQIVTGDTKLTRGFVNYLGIGVDARITYKVEMYRRKSKCINLALYACIGLCKFFHKIRTTSQTIQSFQSFQSQSYRIQQKNVDMLKEQLIQSKGNQINLKTGFGGLLALNSLSYMAGIQNVWNTNKLGIVTQKPPKFEQQRFNDGKIQFLAFKNQLRLGLQSVGNFGTRVDQGQGPYLIKFTRNNENSHIYIQIDGEPFKFRHLKQISIRKSNITTNGKIKVLIKKN